MDFVAVGVNLVAAIVLVGGVVGAIVGAPSLPDAALAPDPGLIGPEKNPPPEEDKGEKDEDDDAPEERRGHKRYRDRDSSGQG